MPMDAKTYSDRRDALVKLLDRTCETLQDVHDKNADMNIAFVGERLGEMRGIAKRVCEDNFSIALVSKFQGGKSTSFNTMHGRPFPISPMGDGAIKTSSSVIRAWNVTDPAERKCLVTWRTDEELAWVFQSLLEKQVLALAPDRFAAKEFKKELKLSNPTDLALARQALQKEIAAYKADMAAYNDDDRDTLAIAAAIITFHDHPEIVALRKRTEFKEDELASLLRFPPKYTIRLLDFFNGNAAFEAREMAFAFVAKVDAKLASDSLALTGCAITDCPGLSASGYDTRLAMEVIAKSDAVWYLLDGKAAGNAELTDIAKAHQAAGHKIFFTLNMRSDVNPAKSHILDNIIPHQVAAINGRGIPLTQEKIVLYHALLAYLAGLGSRLLDGSASQETKEQLLKQANDMGNEVSTAEDAWEELASEMLHRLKVKESKNEFNALKPRLSPRGIEIVRKESGFDDILAKLQNFVINNRAKAILIDNAQKAATANTDIEGVFAQREADLLSKEEDCKKKYDAMEKKLEEFIKRAQRENDILESRDTDRALAEDLLEAVVIKSIPDMATKAAPKIYDQSGVLQSLLGRIGWGKPTGARIGNILQEEFETAAADRYQGWAECVRNGRNRHFNDFTSKVENRRKRLEEDWEVFIKDSEMGNLPPPTELIGSEGGSLKLDDILSSLDQRLGQDEMINLGINAAAIGGGAAIGTLILPGLGTAIGALGGIAIALLKEFFTSRSAYVNRIEEDIKSKAPDELRGRRADFVDKSADKLSVLRKPYIEAFNLGFDNMRKKLHEMRDTAMSDLGRKKEEREGFARRCHAIRKNQIAPLRKEIESYVEQTLPLC